MHLFKHWESENYFRKILYCDVNFSLLLFKKGFWIFLRFCFLTVQEILNPIPQKTKFCTRNFTYSLVRSFVRSCCCKHRISAKWRNLGIWIFEQWLGLSVRKTILILGKFGSAVWRLYSTPKFRKNALVKIVETKLWS